MNKRILVTGANGQLGKTFQVIAKNSVHQFVFATSKDLNISCESAVKDFFKTKGDFDVVINCAAYTKVDLAEDEQEKALLVNATAVNYLLNALSPETTFIHYSTDYVFNGKGYQPYKETDETDPINFYGHSKLEGEKIINNHKHKKSYIIRTSWVYSPFGVNFVKTMLRLTKTKEEIKVVCDQIGSPTYTFDLANFTLDCLINGNPLKPTIYNYSNQGVCSWYDFASEVITSTSSRTDVNPILSKDFQTKAQRPFYSVLSKQKLVTDYLELKIPYWRNSLNDCLELIRKLKE